MDCWAVLSTEWRGSAKLNQMQWGVVTRRPLELRFNHLQDAASVSPSRRSQEKSSPTSQGRCEILTDRVAGTRKAIVPIVMNNIYSHNCPDLTLVDLHHEDTNSRL